MRKIGNFECSGEEKILLWDKVNFYGLLEQMTAAEIDEMNRWLDSQGFDFGGLCESRAEYDESVLFAYIKDWLQWEIGEEQIEQAKALFPIYCAAVATRRKIEN